MLPTVANILGLDAVRRGKPRVVAGGGRLDTPVRWAHAIELADAARLLRGGELVLTTGIALPADEGALGTYVAELAGVGVSALAVELGRRYTAGLPDVLVAAAESRGLPLIVFEREVPFVGITEAVHSLIIDDHLEQLRASARLHEVFTDLAVAGAGPPEILRQAALLAGRPVILEDLAHHVLACEPAGADPARLLGGFAVRSQAVAASTRTTYDEPSGWLVTMVGARGEDWGRLILACDAPPGPSETVLVERAATTLALARLLTRQHESLERQAHATLISAILAQAVTDPDEAAVRARALGLPVTGRQLITVVIRSRQPVRGLLAQARALELAEAMATACRGARVPALIGSLDGERAAALLSLDRQADADTILDAVCSAARQHTGTGAERRALRSRAGAARRARAGAPGTPPRTPGGTGTPLAEAVSSPVETDDPVIAVGSVATSIAQVRRSLLEAKQVADTAAQSPGVPGQRPFYRLADLHVRGLLQLLQGDARLGTFIDRELGPLLAYDQAHGTGLTGLLGAYLAEGGNKAATAARTHLARPTLYERLRQIERILDVDLESAEARTSLHVALLARQDGA